MRHPNNKIVCSRSFAAIIGEQRVMLATDIDEQYAELSPGYRSTLVRAAMLIWTSPPEDNISYSNASSLINNIIIIMILIKVSNISLHFGWI
jgi:hypothetical protein